MAFGLADVDVDVDEDVDVDVDVDVNVRTERLAATVAHRIGQGFFCDDDDDDMNLPTVPPPLLCSISTRQHSFEQPSVQFFGPLPRIPATETGCHARELNALCQHSRFIPHDHYLCIQYA